MGAKGRHRVCLFCFLNLREKKMAIASWSGGFWQPRSSNIFSVASIS